MVLLLVAAAVALDGRLIRPHGILPTVSAVSTARPFSQRHPRIIAVVAEELCDLEGVACAYDPEEIDRRFADEPLAVAARLADVMAAFTRIKLAEGDGGETLRNELGRLGPVFCKVGQTLATRPDIIGLETSRNLGQLQDAIAPESGGPELAMATLTEAVGDISTSFSQISEQPLASASLAEVYRATTSDGVRVAVKIRARAQWSSPGTERRCITTAPPRLWTSR
jgi:hypothetical protein